MEEQREKNDAQISEKKEVEHEERLEKEDLSLETASPLNQWDHTHSTKEREEENKMISSSIRLHQPDSSVGEKNGIPAKKKKFTPQNIGLIGCGSILLILFVTSITMIIVYADEMDAWLSDVESYDENSYSSEYGEEGFNYNDQSTKVKMLNEMEVEEISFVENYLHQDEKLVAFYDVWVDKSEVTILTDRRLIYAIDGRISEMKLDNIEEIEYLEREAADGGYIDLFIISDKDKKKMKIEVYQGEGGDFFYQLLQEGTGIVGSSEGYGL
ncbi:hypothetical protein [Mechercharimyces sp. CAU 1602]|uniref:hypothetical protein n=1 Tax=Mechercharimyces sp. CAU 1602 TaxID=2973933 RepID=UPI00216195DA|nr:hypothetical protein [Mechercharimyces sp. CAU 1602]MCS1352339.1 hypothetical protein [Mechercharimyces sp. CAU 1602]